MTSRLLALFLGLISLAASGQNSKADTTFISSAAGNAIQLYSTALQGQSRLYNGTDYPIYEALQKDQHPYFSIDDWSPTTLHYAGENFFNIDAMYDICRDKLVIEHHSHHERIELINEKLERFSILDHTFIHLNGDSLKNIKDGFYDSLYSGTHSQVFSRHEKSLQKKVANKLVTYFFDSRTQLFILKDGFLHPVKTKASVLSVYSDRQRDLKQFVNRNKLRFNADRAGAIVQMAAFYDTQTAIR